MNKISILDIIEDTTVDGPGFRTAIYAAACQHACKGCHNPDSWNMNNGTFYSIESLLSKVKESDFGNVTFTGGDPLMQVEAFTELAKRIKTETNKTIWCYTGYSYEQVISSKRLSQILSYINVLVDGRFVQSLKDESLLFRGSSNQRLIDVQESLRRGEVIIWDSNVKSKQPLLYSNIVLQKNF